MVVVLKIAELFKRVIDGLGRNEGGKRGHNSSGAESLRGVPNDSGWRRKVLAMSQALTSIQYMRS